VSVIGVHRHIWRRVVSGLVAYAFALQMVLFAFAAPAVAGRAADQDALSAGVCLHDQGAPGTPVNNSGGDEHCKLCPAGGGHQAFTAPALAHHEILRTAEAAPLPSARAPAPRTRAYTNAQPRGPPLAA
jgi:hypothetical protein